jgi:hypothetical protein
MFSVLHEQDQLHLKKRIPIAIASLYSFNITNYKEKHKHVHITTMNKNSLDIAKRRR